MTQAEWPMARTYLDDVWSTLGGNPSYLDDVHISGEGELQSPYAITDLAAASFATIGAALRELLGESGAAAPTVRVDRRMSASWYYMMGPAVPLAAEKRSAHNFRPFRTADGRLLRVQSGYYVTQRRRLIEALEVGEDHDAMAAVVEKHNSDEIVEYLVSRGVAAAVNRSVDEWRQHPAGRAVAKEPIVGVTVHPSDVTTSWRPLPGRPLAGIKVLDLTRVVAGPTATRFLAACGAEVLRLDAPGSDEAKTPYGGGSLLWLGKRLALLDLKSAEGLAQFRRLLADADVLVHGYRPGGIDEIISEEERRRIKPNLVEVALRAYGWEGPWKMRRGFDTITQWGSGMCDETQAWALADPERRLPLDQMGELVDASIPRHLVASALDVGAGYHMAASAIRGLTRRLTTGAGSTSRLSLARTATMLIEAPRVEASEWMKLPVRERVGERVYWDPNAGPSRRAAMPVELTDNVLYWDRGVEGMGASRPVWSFA
ncbi:hypothetical protein F8568_031660 [Actinomadura sp. LD22]|uniref:CoA transferase n=1 Tax=Actinomadura physcomitrii TaxID=2650748 RepID=A0A6I4MPV5_9ACTN|nr:CoA transferase [Actinomadura physcomitrii]MWA04849.1 hypothetical protein [Actinomadura physcomitrii]